MLAHSFVILVIVSTSLCISRVISLRPAGNDDYMQGSTVDNVNPFVAARQRLKQQQLQYEQAKYKYFADNNERRAYDFNGNNNNDMAYSEYLQQQQQQRLQNGIASIGKTNLKEAQAKANDKHISALNDFPPDAEGETEKVAAKKKSDLNEIFGSYQHAARMHNGANNNKEDKTNLRGDYEVSNGESQHSGMAAQNEFAKSYQQTKLARRSTALPPQQNAADDENEEELDLDLPYGIQNVRKRMARHKPDHTKSITYQSLCPTKRIAIPLETSGYEYRPSHYIEVTCAHYTPAHSFEIRKNRICSEAGFSCIQLNRTIHLIRRNKAASDECWESEIRIVPSGCECMWPKHDNGDIAAYHEAQKRFGAYANVQANADYEQGVGYRQIQPQQAELFGINGLRRNENADGVGFEAFEYN
uniref:Spaetzle domain-containing protein n=1 Tax=Bactrocera latifrons TaxID=174628 RepID=A0A0K8VH08_BACLA